MKRFLASPFFLIALIAFFLPFFAVTCAAGDLSDLGSLPGADPQAQEALEATEVSGYELVTGEAEENLNETGGIDSPTIPGIGPSPGATPGFPGLPTDPTGGQQADLGMTQIWAIAAAAVALLGIFLALLAGRAGGIIALVLGAAGAALLFLLQSEFKDSLFGGFGEQVEQFITVEPRIGFWLALAGFGLAAVMGLVRLFLPDRPAMEPPATTGTGFGAPPPAGPPPTGPPPPAAPPPAGPPPAGPAAGPPPAP